jgi:hypothetical protein
LIEGGPKDERSNRAFPAKILDLSIAISLAFYGNSPAALKDPRSVLVGKRALASAAIQAACGPALRPP